MSTGIESCCSRRSWRNWTASVPVDEIEPESHRPCSLRHQRRPRSVKLCYIFASVADEQPGVAADIGHINTKSTVTGYQSEADGLEKALEGAEIVLIPAGVPRKPGMTRDGKRHEPNGMGLY